MITYSDSVTIGVRVLTFVVSQPVVTNSSRVLSLRIASWPMAKPHSWPTATPSSSDTRLHNVMAARRRGCVTMMNGCFLRDACSSPLKQASNFFRDLSRARVVAGSYQCRSSSAGVRDDLPEPVAPLTITNGSNIECFKTRAATRSIGRRTRIADAAEPATPEVNRGQL